MSLKDILERIVSEGEKILLRDDGTDWEASTLLHDLSETRLKKSAHFQPGMYIADIDDGGYLGRVLYRVVQKG